MFFLLNSKGEKAHFVCISIKFIDDHSWAWLVMSCDTWCGFYFLSGCVSGGMPALHFSSTVHNGDPISQSRTVEGCFSTMNRIGLLTVCLGIFSQLILTFLKPRQTWVGILLFPLSSTNSSNQYLLSVSYEPGTLLHAESMQHRPRLRFPRAYILVGLTTINK